MVFFSMKILVLSLRGHYFCQHELGLLKLIIFTSFPMSEATWIGFLPFLSAMPGLLGQRIRTHDKKIKFNLLYLAPSDKSISRDFLWNIRHSYIYPNTVLSKYVPIICPLSKHSKTIEIKCHLSFSNTARCKSDSWFGPYWQLTTFLWTIKIHYW